MPIVVLRPNSLALEYPQSKGSAAPMCPLSRRPERSARVPVRLDDITLRLVAYHAKFAAAHWCAKGHILYVVVGNLVIDNIGTPLSPGTTRYALRECRRGAHRRLCGFGATVVIVG